MDRHPPPPHLVATFALLFLLPALPGQEKTPPPYRDVTEATRNDPKELERLQKPGTVLFRDGFESEGWPKTWFEVQGRKKERAQRVRNEEMAHRGKGYARFLAPDREGKASSAGARGWLGSQGHEVLHFRRHVRFDENYDQGHLNHTGGGISGVAGSNKWGGMGKAGIKPTGDDRFSCRFEPWRAWGKHPAPGVLHLYTYWVDMKGDRDGKCWGNMLWPPKDKRLRVPRGRWICLEQRIAVNRVGHRDGELAAWVDGKLYLHLKGLRWRTSEKVTLKRFEIGVYIHEAEQDNVVLYDDVALSTGYLGPAEGR